eukprot:351557-Chlamydomonas_euryale.AAC.17
MSWHFQPEKAHTTPAARGGVLSHHLQHYRCVDALCAFIVRSTREDNMTTPLLHGGMSHSMASMEDSPGLPSVGRGSPYISSPKSGGASPKSGKSKHISTMKSLGLLHDLKVLHQSLHVVWPPGVLVRLSLVCTSLAGRRHWDAQLQLTPSLPRTQEYISKVENTAAEQKRELDRVKGEKREIERVRNSSNVAGLQGGLPLPKRTYGLNISDIYVFRKDPSRQNANAACEDISPSQAFASVQQRLVGTSTRLRASAFLTVGCPQDRGLGGCWLLSRLCSVGDV